MVKLKKVSVADIIESIEAHVLPFSKHRNQMARIQKLFITFRLHNAVSVEDCEETLASTFLRALENAIKSHLKLLRDISGIKASEHSKKLEADGDASSSASQGEEKDRDGDDDGVDDGDDERAEDLGSDLQKRKQQTTDEMDYEYDSEGNSDQGSPMEDEVAMEDDNEDSGASEMPYRDEEMIEPESTAKSVSKEQKKSMTRLKRKVDDRHIFVAVNGRKFEVHFRFDTEDPHLLLDQVLYSSFTI